MFSGISSIKAKIDESLKLKGKSPEAAEGEEEAFYCLAVGFVLPFL